MNNENCEFCKDGKQEVQIIVNNIEFWICKRCYNFRESFKNDEDIIKNEDLCSFRFSHQLK